MKALLGVFRADHGDAYGRRVFLGGVACVPAVPSSSPVPGETLGRVRRTRRLRRHGVVLFVKMSPWLQGEEDVTMGVYGPMCCVAGVGRCPRRGLPGRYVRHGGCNLVDAFPEFAGSRLLLADSLAHRGKVALVWVISVSLSCFGGVLLGS